ncbi:hypothetical protein P886_4480 [Alteromonadaceae bacterium 2753L.S.0a.02]|nr:hypothetical protein P886_4480 [Alteromonadaceae bacterium 2753L.S.0a.02]
MKTQANNPNEQKHELASHRENNEKHATKYAYQFMDNRAAALTHRTLQESANNTSLRKQAAHGVVQKKALSIGSVDVAENSQKQSSAVSQFVPLDVGQTAPNVQSQADVLAAGVRGDTLFWPSMAGVFNADYAGSVDRAMRWGLLGGEGSAGWYTREYTAAHFHAIATAAGASSNNLAGIDASLDNNKNKTLIAIRAFRGPNNGSMAGQTEADLGLVHAAVNGQAAALHAAGLINNAAAHPTLIEADPAEAHPNTLPTAKVDFGGAGTVYFKGRGRDVENALVGSGNSAARALSSLGGAHADGPAGVGMHGFVAGGAATPSQIAGDVGAEVAPALTPVTATETARSYLPGWLGGADIPARPEAIDAWFSAAKGALLASLTATTDLHASNIVAGRSGKKHIIDAEFLLDVTQWQAYQNMLAGGAIANFDVAKYVPPWLQQHTATLSAGTKALMADAVVNRFIALGADKTHVWANIVAPIRALINTPALLRVIPLATDDFLRRVTTYHNAPGAIARVPIINQLWLDISQQMNNIVVMANAIAGRAELNQNLSNGMVPLFHVRSSDGVFLLNKATNIGATVAGRSVDDLLLQAGAAVSARYADMAQLVRARMTA